MEDHDVPLAKVPDSTTTDAMSLTFKAAADIELLRQDGSLKVYAAVADMPRFAIDGLPADLPLGLYRFDIETPNAVDILEQSVLLAQFAGKFQATPIRATFERFADRLEVYAVLPPGAQELFFSPHFYADELAIGRVALSRVSTTRRRVERSRTVLKSWARSPSLLGREIAKFGGVLWREGFAGVKRDLVEAINPTRILRIEDEMQVELFLRSIGRRNRGSLTAFGVPTNAETPSLTIVVPVYRTPEEWLGRLLASLASQSDQDFEVVLVFDGPQKPLEAFAARTLAGPFRHRIVTTPQNGGASAACNAGLKVASGDYVVIVDHDDLLEKHFVEAFRTAMTARPADIYFADEAVTDGAMGVVRGIATRGRFDLRYYLSHPYIVHPIVLRRELLLAAGGFDETLSVSQDIDVLLRCLVHTRNVVQVPLLLYLWRTHEGSLGHAGAGIVATNTKEAIRRYLGAATDWTAFDVRDGFNFNEYDVRPPLPEGARAAIVIPTKNRDTILSTCLASIEAARSRNRTPHDIFVVDHQSDEPATLELFDREAKAGRITVLPYAGPWNYAAINNEAVRRIRALGGYTHLVFMNNDIEIVTQDWLDRMIAQFSWPDVGIVGCCLQYPDGRVQHGGVLIGIIGAAEHAHKFEALYHPETGKRLPSHLSSLVATRDYNAVTAALMMTPVALFDAVGGFDEKLAVGFNDTDLCLRIGALGYRSTYVGGVVATHYESLSRGSTPHEADSDRFRERYAELIERGDDNQGAMVDRSVAAVTLTLKSQRDFFLSETLLQGADFTASTSSPTDSASSTA